MWRPPDLVPDDRSGARYLATAGLGGSVLDFVQHPETRRAGRDIPFVLVDKHRVRQIPFNLFPNAQQAGEDGPDPFAEVGGLVVCPADRGVSIDLTGDGVGMSPENLSCLPCAP